MAAVPNNGNNNNQGDWNNNNNGNNGDWNNNNNNNADWQSVAASAQSLGASYASQYNVPADQQTWASYGASIAASAESHASAVASPSTGMVFAGVGHAAAGYSLRYDAATLFALATASVAVACQSPP